MKKHINEPDFIGGQGSLTKEEEIALSQYFAKRKEKANKIATPAPTTTRQSVTSR